MRTKEEIQKEIEVLTAELSEACVYEYSVAVLAEFENDDKAADFELLTKMLAKALGGEVVETKGGLSALRD